MEETKADVKSALDLACGTGILCRILHETGVAACGADLSEGMIAIAREHNPEIPFEVADMITYRPEKRFDLVTCTGDALNHIPELRDVERIFRNVYECLNPGGFFIFDLLNEHEVSDDEPFEFDFSDTLRVWFQMTRPTEKGVNLQIRVYENGVLQVEENIRERIHGPEEICALLRQSGFRVLRLSNRMLDSDNPGTTWFVIAAK
jgi:2-polyprenyl-3-methyl-5-hydroxy-6-metoxy-1,4-benzoquinol methylase